MVSGDFESHRLRSWGYQVAISARHAEVGTWTGQFLNLPLPGAAPIHFLISALGAPAPLLTRTV